MVAAVRSTALLSSAVARFFRLALAPARSLPALAHTHACEQARAHTHASTHTHAHTHARTRTLAHTHKETSGRAGGVAGARSVQDRRRVAAQAARAGVLPNHVRAPRAPTQPLHSVRVRVCVCLCVRACVDMSGDRDLSAEPPIYPPTHPPTQLLLPTCLPIHLYHVARSLGQRRVSADGVRSPLHAISVWRSANDMWLLGEQHLTAPKSIPQHPTVPHSTKVVTPQHYSTTVVTPQYYSTTVVTPQYATVP